MHLYERMKILEKRDKEESHCIRACSDKYCHDGKVVWIDFIKVACSGGKSSDDDDDEYRGDDGVKFQT